MSGERMCHVYEIARMGTKVEDWEDPKLKNFLINHKGTNKSNEKD